MPFNKVNTEMSPAQEANIQAAIDALISNLPAKFNLTKKERIDLQNIDTERYPYVKRTVEVHALSFPNFVTGNAGTTAEATIDFKLFNQFEKYIPQLLKVLEIYKDTQQVGGSEAYRWFRAFYNTAVDGAENQVPGADSVVDDLKTLFDKTPAPAVEPVV